jgi:pyruvate dehydrogenase E2 component (dihydrolipoamide acetyltransferase)
VDVPGRLAVPVVRNADRLDVDAISQMIARFAEQGRQGALANADMAGGTFTVSNVGMFDVLAFTPIINYPQTAILGVGTVRTLPRYSQEAFTILEPRKIVQLALTYDHRIIDGAPAARFLQSVKYLLEEPQKLF